MAGKSGREISAVPAKSVKSTLLSWEAMLVILFIGVNIFCVAISPYYNVVNMLRESPKYLAEIMILFPMAFILLLGEIDISVGSIVCLAATMSCFAMNVGMPLPVVMIVGIGTGLVCGLINATLAITFRELPAMIITLSTQIIFRGIAEVSLGSGGSVGLTDTTGFQMLSKKIGIFPISFFIVVAIAVVFIFISTKMNYGRRLYAIGSNSKTAFYSGIKVNKVVFIAFVLTGIFSGLCALFTVSVTYGANTTTGTGFEMDVIAMAVFGGISTLGGKGKLIGAFISAFIITCLRVGLGQINTNAQVINIILGALLIIAVLVPYFIEIIGNKKKLAGK